MSTLSYHIVLLSGGVGSRMGATTPKQFLDLAGQPVLVRCLRSFVDQGLQRPFVLVAHPEHAETSQRLAGQVLAPADLIIVPGGASRHDSTLHGIQALPGWSTNLPDQDVILIHDVARPLISAAELARLKGVFAADPACQIASLAGAMHETIVQASGVPGVVQHSLNRDRVATIKTPQAIRVACLRRLLASHPHPTAELQFTDLLTWGEAGGVAGQLVEAGPTNLKITHAEDLPLLAMLQKHYSGA